MLKIVADENMPLVQELFACYGEVSFCSGRDISAELVKDADVLLVRSITQVDENLLAASSVKFVGSATIGIDHVDVDYLQRRGIFFANAPGCNANAVVQYVFSALCALPEGFQGKQVGIVGCGNVGGRLYQKMRSMGVECRCYDPFLTATDNADLCSLSEVLQADIISMHTPLTECGPFPSRHMLNTANLKQLRVGAVLINAGRGAAIANQDLLAVLESRDDLKVVLDVWEHEPQVEPALLAKVKIATPHIAGYSVEGKENGTRMVLKAFLAWQGTQDTSELAATSLTNIRATSLCEAVLSAYDVRADDRRTREQLRSAGTDCAARFDRLRKTYPTRPEFTNYRVIGVADAQQRHDLDVLGFVVADTKDQL